MDVALVTRIKDLNGDFPVRGTELIDEKLLKEWSVGLNVDDIREFIDWLTSSSRVAVSGREKLRAKLQDLQHFRKAAWHVFCPDGLVPAEKRMCIVLLDSRKFFVFSFPGNLETVMKLKNCVDASQLGIGVQPGTIYHDLKMDPTKTPVGASAKSWPVEEQSSIRAQCLVMADEHKARVECCCQSSSGDTRWNCHPCGCGDWGQA